MKENRPGKAAIALAVLVYTALMALRLYDARGLSFWADELVSLNFARGPWSGLRWDNSPLLFNSLLKLWPGDPLNELSYRVLPLVFFALTPLLVLALTRRFFSARAGWLALAFSAAHAVQFYYAVELRPYSLFAFAGTANLWFFLRALESRRIGAGYIVSSVFFAAAHFFAVVALGAQLLVFIRRWEGLRRHPLKIAAVSLLPLFIGAVALSYVRTDALAHLAFEPAWKALVFPYQIVQRLYSESFAWIFLGVLFLVRGKVRDLELYVLFCLLTAIPMALVTGLNPVQPTYFLFLGPPMMIILAVFATGLKRPVVALVFTAHVFALDAWIIRSHWGQDRSGWREAGRAIPVSAEILVIPLAHAAVKFPYLAQHPTYFPPPEDQVVSFDDALAPAREAWLVYPATPAAGTTALEWRDTLVSQGFTQAAVGDFVSSSAHPLRHIRLVRSGPPR